MNDTVDTSGGGAGGSQGGPDGPEQRWTETVALLQDLGLKEYEARCFMVLTQVPAATAREIADRSEVPRTRVYDAVRVLEAQGLVEVQHASPKQFRAVSVEEAAATLRQRYDEHIDTLQSSLDRLEVEPEPDGSDRVHSVWSLTGREGIQSRTLDAVERADSEVVLLVVEDTILTDALFERLHAAVDRGVDVVVGARTESVVETVRAELDSVEVFETELGWLTGPGGEHEVAISRLLLVDREALLVSSYYPDGEHEDPTERAVFADGLENGVVVLVRRLIASGLLPAADPAR